MVAVVNLQEIGLLMKNSNTASHHGSCLVKEPIKPTNAVMVALKLIVTGGFLWFVFHKVDLGPLAIRLGDFQTEWVVVALAFLFGQLLLTGVRWYFVSRLVSADISMGLATRLVLIGQFFNQVLPSSVGGDGVRAWLLSREGISIKRALVSVVCDRAAALVLLTLIVACTLPVVIVPNDVAIPSAKTLVIVINVFSLFGLLFLFFWGEAFSEWLISTPMRLIGVIIRDLRRVLFSSVDSLWIVGLSIAVQAMLVMNIYFCALALGTELGTLQLLMLPLIMLISSIPISFGGWGLRESVMITGLGFVGVSANDALAVSVSFGIAQMVIGLPGLGIAMVYSWTRKVKHAT